MVAVGMSDDADVLTDDPAIPKAMISALQAENAKMSATMRAHDRLIQTFRLRIAKLKKQVFGKSSEKIEHEIAQLELALEDLLIAAAESHVAPVDDSENEDTPVAAIGNRPECKPRRRPGVSDATPRERRELDPGACCPDCGGNPRRWAGTAPPAAVCYFAPDWKEDHVHQHLSQASGILQADGYKGCAKLYEPAPDGICRFRAAACWAHLRRDFHDVWSSTNSEIAREALDRIGALYDIERDIAGQPADVRLAARKKHGKPKVEAFRAWAEQQLTRIPGKSGLAKAFRYGLSRWPSFCLFLEDGRVAIDNNAAERALRPSGIGRKNWFFAGADTGAETLARHDTH